MKYFNGITDIEEAKQRYRTLAKKLHPDMGGSAAEFRNLQEEYKSALLQIPQIHRSVRKGDFRSSENELFGELGKLAKVLIKNQVPQNYLKQKIQTAESPLKKSLFADIVSFLDDL